MVKPAAQKIILAIGVLLLVVGCTVKNYESADCKKNLNETTANSSSVTIQNSSVSSNAQDSLPSNTVNNYFQPVFNSSMEALSTSDPTKPELWSNNSWGNNRAEFTYLKEGYSGKRSLKTEVIQYKDGDAKWFFEPVKLLPGDYVFIDYYRSNVDTRVVAAVTTATGDKNYIDLPYAPASKEWIRYENTFAMPKDGETLSIYHLLSRNGYLITDDYALKPYSYKGFDRGLVTITFDDGWEENSQTALPIMQEFGYKSNQFYATIYIENPYVPNPKELIQRFVDAGHEIGSHSITHPYLTALSDKQLTVELSQSKLFLENYLGVSIKYFATPYGDYNTNVRENIMKYYDANRAADIGYNSKDNFDVSRLKKQNVLSTTTLEEIGEWVEKAKTEKLWLILGYHVITENPNLYDTTPQMFRKHMQVIKDTCLPVVTFSQALAEIGSQ